MTPKNVTLHTFSEFPLKWLKNALERREIFTTKESVLDVVLVDSYLDPKLDLMNSEALLHKRPYLLIKPGGNAVCVGPLVLPGETACWRCLTDRLGGHSIDDRLAGYAAVNRYRFPHAGSLDPVLDAFEAASSEICLWYEGKTTLGGKIISFDTRTLNKREHVIIKRPQCRACGCPDDAPRPIILESRIKIDAVDGGFRTVTSEETLTRVSAHLDPITGVVGRLERLASENTGPAHIYGASFLIPSFNNPDAGPATFKTSCGKGKSDAQAKTSALCEALERYCRTFQGYECCITSSYAQFDGAIHPNMLLQFSREQYANREKLNASGLSGIDWIPEPFDERTEIAWTPVWSLMENRFKYLPTAYCYDRSPDAGRRFCSCDSNGHAAGNNLEEAILQGFFELVERDSIALWWYNRARVPAVDLCSFEESFFRKIENFYDSIKRSLVVLDITTDLAIPSFVAISASGSNGQQPVIMGSGAHLDARLAIQRALTELCQRLTLALAVQNGEAAAEKTLNAYQLEWWKYATLQNRPYLSPSATLKVRAAADYPFVYEKDLAQDVKKCIEIASRVNIEILVLDQTRPDIGLPVAKVVAPGLRHQRRRLGPGRLFDVPVKIGWISKTTKQHDLNPVSTVF